MEANIWNHHQWITETDPLVLKNMFEQTLKKAGFTIVNFVEYHFQPQGYTALWLLAESHFAVHTFPECGKSYIELSSCNLKDYEDFLALIKDL